MSGNEPWASPGGPQQPPYGTPQQPPYAAPQPPPYGAAQQPPYGAPQQPPYAGPPVGGRPPAWTPPPKPGLVPLRPLNLGDILGAAFGVFRRNPRTTFGTALLFQVVSLLITAGAVAGTVAAAFARVDGALQRDQSAVIAGTVVQSIAILIVPMLLSIAIQSILQGLFVLETSHQVVGERMRLGGLLRQARGRIWALVGWTLLLLAAALVVLGLIGGVIALLVAFGGGVGAGFGVLLGFVGFFGVGVLAVWIGTKTALVPSVLLLERLPLRAAIARSWRLTRGSFWRVFGIIALVGVMINIASSVVNVPVSLISSLVGSTLQPNGGSDLGGIITQLAASFGGQLITLVVTSIGVVILSATVALLYVDLRIRREGLDLELSRYVEARAAQQSRDAGAGADGRLDAPEPLFNPYANPDPALRARAKP
ncbi:hypothetical protein [Frondihabitans australicus]|uniref:Putative PurR-regulated permease PerM n=1 Tax=Frondihabitans australicus TaxID=386892 RepID=A0A495IBH2_9MICO|nr:hypothetical protein [Frondihabitans australicus]RKR73272.1 putative PurR-regulated permease PerM [Frondihabitans australicus]